jgi:hypothetical protein
MTRLTSRPGAQPQRGSQWQCSLWRGLALSSLVAAALLWWLGPRLVVWQLERDAGASLGAVAGCLVGSDAPEGLAGERLRAICWERSKVPPL